MFNENTKANREADVENLMKLKDIMLNSDNWEKYKPYIKAVTSGAMAIHRLNLIDFGKEGEDADRT